MNICMFTNTYLPHVGGVARSVSCFVEDLRQMGHEVMVMAPVYEDQNSRAQKIKKNEVVYLPAIQHFNGSDFSVRIPIPGVISHAIDLFAPDIIHSHHPFLMGDTALRIARKRQIPIVFTHHTLYEQYTHYTPADSEAMKRFVVSLSTHYANLCDNVVAPSQSVKQLIEKRGVEKPVEEIPTGVDVRFFKNGNGKAFRKNHGIYARAFVIGHVGRLAPEKNLAFQTTAVAMVLKNNKNAIYVVVGAGPSGREIKRICEEAGVLNQLVMTGTLTGSDLADAYAAFDIFVFASKTETQGMVLTEAMAAGTPVIALAASGAREVLADDQNGCLLAENTSVGKYAQSLEFIMQNPERLKKWEKKALLTAENFSRQKSADRLERLYESVLNNVPEENEKPHDLISWDNFLHALSVEWDLFSEKAKAVIDSMTS